MIHLYLELNEVKQLPLAFLVIGVYATHITAFSLIANRTTRSPLNVIAANASYVIAGYAAFGFYIWIAGYFGLLNRSFFIVSAIVWGLVAATIALRSRHPGCLYQTTLRSIKAKPLFWVVATATFCVAIVSGTRGIAFDDDYRWQSAEYWVAAGHWVRVPYRLTNGAAMSEMLHVPAAVFGNLTAAHWASTGIWICCALSAASIGVNLGVSTVVSVVAILSIPIFTTEASTLNSDVPAIAFAAAAFVFVLTPTPTFQRRCFLTGGLLFAAVLSTKIIVLACYPAAAAICFFRTRGNLSERLANLYIMATPVAIAALLWMAHTYHLTGRPFDPTGKHLAKTPTDPMWLDGEAAGRIPNLHDVMRLPVEPFLTTLWGQEEPFGGRSGLLWISLLPATAYLVVTGRIAWKPPVCCFAVGLSYYLLLSPVLLKTRFLLLSFVCMAMLSSIAYEHRQQLPFWAKVVVSVVFATTAAVGIADGSRKLLMNVIIETPPARHAPRVI